MDPARRAELTRAYHATTYAAAVPLRIRIGEPNAMLDAMLAELGVEEWAYLTAWNPDAKPRAEEANRAAQEALVGDLRAMGLEPHVGAGEADDGSWPPEPSLFVPGLPREQAIALGRRYHQVAIVAGRRGRAPELVWL